MSQNEIEGPNQITPFDNELTIAYKWASGLEIPIKELIIQNPEEKNVKSQTFERLTDFVRARPNVSLQNLYETLISENRVLFPNGFEQTLSMTYYDINQKLSVKTKFNQINEFFKNVKRGKFFTTERDLVDLFKTWKQQQQVDKDREREQLERIYSNIQILSNVPPLVRTAFDRYSGRFLLDPKINDMIGDEIIETRTPHPIDGLDILNASVLSNRVPFIQFNENLTSGGITDTYNTNEYLKLFTQYKFDSAAVIPPYRKRKGRNTMYMTIWTGTGDSETTTKKSYIQAVYNMENNRFVINPSTLSKTLTIETLIEWIGQVFPSNLVFGDTYEELNVQGVFHVYGLEINELSFLDLVLNNPLFNSYLYVDERDKSALLKKRLTLHYRAYRVLTNEQEIDTTSESKKTTTLSSVRCILNQLYAEPGKTLPYLNEEGKLDEITVGEGERLPYVTVIISRATSNDVAEEFATLFTHLMSVYSHGTPLEDEETPLEESREDIENLYKRIFGDDAVKLSMLTASSRPQTGRTSIEQTAARGKGSSVPRGRKPRIGKPYADLQQHIPDLFAITVPGVKRQIRRKYPTNGVIPKVIEDQDELDEFLSQPLVVNGREYDRSRQFLKFPVGNDEYKILVCPDDTYAFPYYRQNEIVANEKDSGPEFEEEKAKIIKKFPCIPGCAKKDWIEKGDLYSKCDPRQNDEPDADTADVGADAEDDDIQVPRGTPYVPSTATKIVEPGLEGEISVDIANVLNLYNEEEPSVFRRKGVRKGSNSIISCIQLALNGGALPSSNKVELDNQAIADRQDIVNQIQAGEIQVCLGKQQLYDLSDDQIIEKLSDLEVFLDPYLYFRYLEEYYDLNIVVFTIINPKTGKTQRGAEGVGILEIPRHKLFYARATRMDRRTVCIMKSWGLVSSNLVKPQCELIFDSTKRVYVFDPETRMNIVIRDLLSFVLPTSSWQLGLSQTPDVFVPVESSISRFNFVAYFTLVFSNALYPEQEIVLESLPQPVSQFVDIYGKCRGLNYLYQDQFIYIVIPPSEPFNLPPMSLSQVEAQFPSLTLVNQLFSTAPKEALLNNNFISGLWYSVDEESTQPISNIDSYLVLIDPISAGVIDAERVDLQRRTVQIQYNERVLELPEGPTNPLHFELRNTVNFSDRIRKLRRDNSIILQLILWLYIISKMRPEEFLSTYVNESRADQPEDTALIYDFSRLNRKLPNVETVEDGIAYLDQFSTKLITNGMIQLYSQKYYEGVKYYLELFENTVPEHPESEDGLKVSLQRITPVEIKNLYETEADFTSIPFNIVFTSDINLKSWLSFNNKNLQPQTMIHSEIERDMVKMTNPYIYSDDSGLVLIQNVLRDDGFARAIYVAEAWKQLKVNAGFNAEPYIDISSEGEREYPPYKIYSISENQRLKLEEDNSEGEPNPIEILQYYELSNEALSRDEYEEEPAFNAAILRLS